MNKDAKLKEIKELAAGFLSPKEREEFLRDPNKGRAGFEAAEKALRTYGKSSGNVRLAKSK